MIQHVIFDKVGIGRQGVPKVQMVIRGALKNPCQSTRGERGSKMAKNWSTWFKDAASLKIQCEKIYRIRANKPPAVYEKMSVLGWRFTY